MKLSFVIQTHLAALLVAGSLFAADGQGRRPMTPAELQAYAEQATASLASFAGSAFEQKIVSGHFDERNIPYVRGFQRLNGVRVWGSDFVMNDEGSGLRMATGAPLDPAYYVDTKPALTPEQVIRIARQAPGARSYLALEPTTELVIVPVQSQKPKAEFMSVAPHELKAEQMEEVLEHVRLAYHVVAFTRDLLIDANTGEVFGNWSHLKNVDASLNTQWSGAKRGVNTQSGGRYVLTDPTRGFSVYDMEFTSSMRTLFSDYNNDNAWGDGRQFNGNKNKNTDNYQTAAADAFYGMQVTYDLYKNVLGFNGIDGRGTMPRVGVHLGDQNGNPYDNAYYQNNTVQFGDGYQQIFALTPIDVVSHEFSHGVCENTSGYVYQAESGGMNESNSDIMGEMAEFYGAGANSQGSAVPNTGADWLVGGRIMRPSGTPMRWFVKPSKDGRSPDYWTTNAPNVEVHAGSGVGNRAFYFMSVGGQGSNSGQENYSSKLNVNKAGWEGIGNDKAVRIHFKALKDYGRSSDNYKRLRENELRAATDLYGASSREYKVVYTAWAAVAVGTADDVKVPPLTQDQAPTVSGLALTSTGPDNTGALTFTVSAADDNGVSKVVFTVDGSTTLTDTTAPYSVSLPNGLANGSHTVTAVATDTANQTSTPASLPFRVGNIQGDVQAPVVSNVKAAVSGTSATLTADATDNVGVTQVVFAVDGSDVNTDTTAPYAYTVNGLANGSHTLSVTARDAAGNANTPVSITFTIGNPGTTWQEGVTYKPGDEVSYGGKTWVCTFGHTSNSAWYPGAPGLWFWTEKKK